MSKEKWRKTGKIEGRLIFLIMVVPVDCQRYMNGDLKPSINDIKLIPNKLGLFKV